MRTHPILVHTSFTAHLNDNFDTAGTCKKESYVIQPSDRVITFFYTNDELTGINYCQGTDDYTIMQTQEPDPRLDHILEILKTTGRFEDFTIEMVDELIWIIFTIENSEL